MWKDAAERDPIDCDAADPAATGWRALAPAGRSLVKRSSNVPNAAATTTRRAAAAEHRPAAGHGVEAAVRAAYTDNAAHLKKQRYAQAATRQRVRTAFRSAFFVASFGPEIAKDARNFETALLCFICINQKPKDFDPPIERPQTTKNAGVAEIAGEKGEEGRRRQHLPVNDGRCHRASTH